MPDVSTGPRSASEPQPAASGPRRGRGGWPAPAAVVAAGVVIVTGTAWLSSTGVGRAERSLARTVYDLPGPLEPVLVAAMQAGTRGAVVAVGVVVALVAGRRTGFVVTTAGAASWALAAAGKLAELRDRPAALELGRSLREDVAGSGFPSTHAAVAAGLALAMALQPRVPRAVATAAVALAVATGVARVHLGVHWPLDVLGGAALGAVAAGTLVLADRSWVRPARSPWGPAR